MIYRKVMLTGLSLWRHKLGEVCGDTNLGERHKLGGGKIQ